MKKRSTILEACIMVVSIVLLALFLGLPQVLDLDKRANKQKNLSQLTELTLSTNKFLDKYMYSMTADLARIKEKMEYNQRLNVPGGSKYQYVVYGGVKNCDLRFVVSYDLFNILNQFDKLNDVSKLQFKDAVVSYVITAKNRMQYSADKDKYQNFIGYLDNLVKHLDDTKYFRKAKYVNDIKNPQFNGQSLMTYGMIAKSFVGSDLFKNRTLQAGIAMYLSYVNQVDRPDASAETFDTFYKNFQAIQNYTSLYMNAKTNTFAEGAKATDILNLFNEKFEEFYVDNIVYPNRLNKAVLAIGTNAAVNNNDRLSEEFINNTIDTDYQKEVNKKVNEFIVASKGDNDVFTNLLKDYVNECKDRDIKIQINDIYESIFNYMQFNEYKYKSINTKKAESVDFAFNEKFQEFFNHYMLKFNQDVIVNNLTQSILTEKKNVEKTLAGRYKSTNLIKDFRNEMKNQAKFNKAFFASKEYKNVVKKEEKKYLSAKNSEFESLAKTEKLAIEQIEANINHKKIYKDKNYLQELSKQQKVWKNNYANVILYARSNDLDNLKLDNVEDLDAFAKNNKMVIDGLKSKIADAKESYVKSKFKKYKTLFSYVDYCVASILEQLNIDRKDVCDQYLAAVTSTATDFISTKDTPDFGNEFVSEVRTKLNSIYKQNVIDKENISEENQTLLNALNAKLIDYNQYKTYCKKHKVRSSKQMSKADVAELKDVAITPEALVGFYNSYILFIKDKIDKTRFYNNFSKKQLKNAKAIYCDKKVKANDQEWTSIEKQIKELVAQKAFDQKEQFNVLMKQVLANYKNYQMNTYKYDNAFNFDGLLTDLSRTENKMKFYRGPIEFPHYDKDEYYVLFGRFIENGAKKYAISVVVYTDIHNYSHANAVTVRNLGSTNVDVESLQNDLNKQVKSLITKYQNEVNKYKAQEKYKNIQIAHNGDPDFKMTTTSAEVKGLIRTAFNKELKDVVDEFVRNNF